MIRYDMLPWMREYLDDRSLSGEDHKSAEEICDTVKKLWRVAIAAKQNPYPRSPKLEEALAAISEPDQTRQAGYRPTVPAPKDS